MKPTTRIPKSSYCPSSCTSSDNILNTDCDIKENKKSFQRSDAFWWQIRFMVHLYPEMPVWESVNICSFFWLCMMSTLAIIGIVSSYKFSCVYQESQCPVLVLSHRAQMELCHHLANHCRQWTFCPHFLQWNLQGCWLEPHPHAGDVALDGVNDFPVPSEVSSDQTEVVCIG